MILLTFLCDHGICKPSLFVNSQVCGHAVFYSSPFSHSIYAFFSSMGTILQRLIPALVLCARFKVEAGQHIIL